ncbi:hypothetical protein CRI93_12010 [Longimonas halophila]|uniref:PPC domain-containing protein n=1 Tax=Longimonas halophila TaxID=1469170 RepID=A0A2H3NQS7_9BACT|nr:PPC domain-containing DNA-binding protein [Longimonas halophila]PEN05632.1 hypothetical protein CRI93_12010 [Longimonas halophila]
MSYRALSLDPDASHLLVLDQNADFMESLIDFATTHDVPSATFYGIGAFSEATIAFFDREEQVYDPIAVNQQVEVLHVTGNLTWHEGAVRVHAHATLGRPDGSTLGGHLVDATVWPTLELQCQTYNTRVERLQNEAVGLPLIPQST